MTDENEPTIAGDNCIGGNTVHEQLILFGHCTKAAWALQPRAGF
jgi:hypothetical protein